MYQYQKDYPRPQLSRKSWENLNGEWDFAFDDKKEGLKNRWQENFPQREKILVPFTYETKKAVLAARRNIPESGMKENCPWKRKKKSGIFFTLKAVISTQGCG